MSDKYQAMYSVLNQERLGGGKSDKGDQNLFPLYKGRQAYKHIIIM